MTLHAADNCKGNDFLSAWGFRLHYSLIKGKITEIAETFFHRNVPKSKHFLIFVHSIERIVDHERIISDAARRTDQNATVYYA